MADVAQQILAEGKFVRLVRRENWEFAQRRNSSGIVGIVALTKDGKMLLVEQYRPPLGKRTVELPAGLAGDVAGEEDECLEDAARRELLEETGYEAEGMLRLAEGATSAGITDEIITLCRATNLKKVTDGGGDASESIIVHQIPLPEVPAWLATRTAAGCVIDLKVYAGLYFLLNETKHLP